MTGLAHPIVLAGPSRLGTFRHNPVVLTILVFYLVILVAMVFGPIAAFPVELFPARIRYGSMSMPYHLGNGWLVVASRLSALRSRRQLVFL
jgi:hypothetical protein